MSVAHLVPRCLAIGLYCDEGSFTMSRRLEPLTLDVLPRLPDPCRSCVFWELDPVTFQQVIDSTDAEFEKESWLSATLLDWGSCGRVALIDDDVVGYVTYAPSQYVPRSLGFPTSPVSPDAVLLMSAWISPQHRGHGMGRMLIQGAAKDLTRRGVRAIETFGAETPPAAGCGGGTAEQADAVRLAQYDDTDIRCLTPAPFYRAVGFKTARAHFRYPRLRLDLRTALSWREDVEQAIERILGGVRQPVLNSTQSASSNSRSN